MKKISSNAITHGKFVIHYPRFDRLRDQLVMCIDRTQEKGEPHCMALEGKSGAGKTTLVKTFVDAFPRSDEASGVRIPVLYVLTPSPVTVKGMASKMLSELGDPATEGGQRWSKNARIVNYIRACGVQLVILDDIQHLLTNTDRAYEVSDWLKVLIKETNVPFVFVGLEGTIDPILMTNEQLARLFSARVTLQSFIIESQQQAREYADFVGYVLLGSGFVLSKAIEFKDLVIRLYAATDGLVGYTVNLLGDADYAARNRGSDEISEDDLREAYVRTFGYMEGVNPLDFSLPVPVLPSGSSTRKPRNKNGRVPSASEVLKASGQ